MDTKLIVSASPHLRSEETTAGLMANVIVALTPCVVASAIIFGLRALLVTAVHGSDQQGTQTKDDGRGHDARGQGHDHVGHQAGGRLLRAQVRGGRNNKLRIHYLLPPFLISPR